MWPQNASTWHKKFPVFLKDGRMMVQKIPKMNLTWSHRSSTTYSIQSTKTLQKKYQNMLSSGDPFESSQSAINHTDR